MRVSYFAAALAIISPLVSARPAAQPNVDERSHIVSAMQNLTERTYYSGGGSYGGGSYGGGSSYTSTWTYDRCDQISGSAGWGSYKVNYNLGCVCLSDVDDFCDSNNLSDWVASWMKNYLQNSGNYRYPTGAQPTCDDRGGYTCPNGKNSDGTCASQAALSCGDNRCLQSDGKTCCPRGTYLMGGKCCAKTCSGAQGQCVGSASCPSGQVLSGSLCCPSGWTGYTKTCCPSGQKEDPSNPGTCICNDASQKVNPSNTAQCISKCSSGLVWKTTQCCKSYQSEVSGKCGCPDASYTDTGSACNLKCTDQQNYNTNTGRCDNKCASGSTWSNSARNPSGMCCQTGSYCQQTICCPTGQEETNGKCCAIGSIYKNGRCQAPSGKRKRQALAGVSHQQPLDKSKLNLDEKLCPKGLSVCPIPGGATGQYECLDSYTDLQSCGGCASLGKGKDCTAIPGARWMGCEAGSCVVYNCRPGWKLVGESECVKA